MNSVCVFSANFSDKKSGKSCILYGLDDVYTHVAVVKLGSHSANFNELEEIDERRENVRIAMAGALLLKNFRRDVECCMICFNGSYMYFAEGVQQLAAKGVQHISVDPCGDAEGTSVQVTAYIVGHSLCSF